MATVEIRTHNVITICRVHLASAHIQRDALGTPRCDEVFDVATIEIRTLDLIRAPVRPVHLRWDAATATTTAIKSHPNLSGLKGRNVGVD